VALICLVLLLPVLLSAEYQTHRVVSGDTLYNISKRYGVTIDQIKQLNGLRDNTISLNQVLKIREADPTAPIAASTPAVESGSAPLLTYELDIANSPYFYADLDSCGNWVAARKTLSTSVNLEDSQGNRYFADAFSGAVQLGTHKIISRASSAQPAPDGVKDTYLAKLDSKGNWSWVKNLAMISTLEPSTLHAAITEDDRILVAGTFSGQAEFGQIKLISAGSTDVFIAGLDADGNWLWAKSAGGPGADICRALIMTGENVVLAGDMEATALFGTLVVSAGGGKDTFIASLDTSGNWLWASASGLPEPDILTEFRQTRIDGFSATISVTDIADAGDPANSNTQVLYALIGANGEWRYKRPTGADPVLNPESLFAACVDGGAWYAMNEYAVPVPDSIYAGASASKGSLARLDQFGNLLWSVRLQADDVYIRSIVSGTNGNVYVTGTFQGSLETDAGNIESLGAKAQFYACFDTSGNCLWIRKWQGTGLRHACADRNGNLYLAAQFREYIDAGGKPYYLDDSDGDILICKIDASGNWLWASKTASGGVVELLGMEILDNGQVRVTGSRTDQISFGNLLLPH
jgi:LysM repeat protein